MHSALALRRFVGAGHGASSVFENNVHGMTATLARMQEEALRRSQFDQTRARQKVIEYISQDARFGEYDAARLADRAQECRQSGKIFDLNDTYLRKGGVPRPGGRRGYSGSV